MLKYLIGYGVLVATLLYLNKKFWDEQKEKDDEVDFDDIFDPDSR